MSWAGDGVAARREGEPLAETEGLGVDERRLEDEPPEERRGTRELRLKEGDSVTLLAKRTRASPRPDA